MSEVEIKIKLTGCRRPVIRELRTPLKQYLTNSGDPEITVPEAGQRSVELELEIADDYRIRVIKKENRVFKFHEAKIYIDSTCEMSRGLLETYFLTPDVDLDDEDPITLTLTVIMQPLLMNTNAADKIYVKIDEATCKYI